MLIVGLAVVLLMAVALVVDASAAFLQRQGLDTVADGAALAGADAGSRNLEALYGAGVTDAQRLAQAEDAARAAVATYFRDTAAQADYPGLRWTIGFDAAEASVIVEVDAPLDLPLTVPGSPEVAMIGATGSAVVQVDATSP